MRLSVAPAIIACSGYKPEPPRKSALEIVAAIAGLAVAYYAISMVGMAWLESFTRHAP